MRCVDYDSAKIEMPEGVDQLRQQLLDAQDDAARAELIDNNSQVWAGIKPQLRDTFYRKCWYTESPQQGGDVDVDHFRPKKRVFELKGKDNPHPGYWWLAFEPDNYRYSCIVANRRRRDVDTDIVGGKADHFPLWDEATRAWPPECDCSEEEPVLLDPCRAADVGLITFRDDGEAMPRFGEGENKKAYERADKSIEYYHLNHTDFVKARQDLRDEIVDFLKEAKRAFHKFEAGDAFHTDTWESAIKGLRRMVAKSAPYSSFCIAYLDQHKDRHEPYLAGVFM